jgi:ankyrin repeat protein
MITSVRELPPHPSLEQYRKQAKDLIKSWKLGDSEAVQRIATYHPRWRNAPVSETRNSRFTVADAQLVIAREHGFESWPKFAKHIEGLIRETSITSKFERAADAIANGDAGALARLLSESPSLIRSRSARVHRGTLLHYVGANGVENYRQKTPRNAIEILKILLRARAEVDAVADMYHRDTTLGLVATSIFPERAGVQMELMQTLLDAGASIDAPGGGSIVNACLANGRGEAADFLAKRGASLDLEGAAGVGRLDIVEGFFNPDRSLRSGATKEQMNSGFSWACEYGRTDVVDFLLKMGMQVDARLRPHGQTGLHWAAYGAHPAIVKLLLERKASVEAKSERFTGTPLDWALFAWPQSVPATDRGRYCEVVTLLIDAGAKLDSEWLAEARNRPQIAELRADPSMRAALRGELPR